MDALHVAAREGSDERVRALLTSGVIDVNERNSQRWTPLMCGASNGHSSGLY